MKGNPADSERLLPLDQLDRCWFLGIAWASIQSFFPFRPEPEPPRELQHWLHFLIHTCQELKLESEELLSFLKSLKNGATSKGKSLPERETLEKMGPVLGAALRARNPYYYDIFIAAGNASAMKDAFAPEMLAQQRSVFAEFLRAFQYLRPVLNRQTFEVIQGAMERWDREWQKVSRGERAVPRPDRLSDLEIKLHGLLVESIEPESLLHLTDRIWAEFLFGLTIIILGMLLLLGAWALLGFLSPWLLSDLTFPGGVEQTGKLVSLLKDSFAILGVLGVSIAGIGRFFWQAGKEIRASYILHLAKERLTHPERPWVI